MRGHVDPQASRFSYFSPDSRAPAKHPLRRIKARADAVLGPMSSEFDRFHAETGRPSIPPEQLLKASLLMALYSLRPDRMFCEMLDYNILFRWFLDMSLEQGGLDQSNFSRLPERLVEADTAKRFFDAVVRAARRANLLSDEHFTVDGTLIEAWASHKSIKPKDGPPATGDSAGGMAGFRGERYANDTHASTTDGEAKLYRKGRGKEARPCFGGHALMENRNGLLIGLAITDATLAEPRAVAPLHGSPAPGARAQAHTRRRQGLSHERLRCASAREKDQPAHREDRRPPYAGARCPHHPPRDEPAKAQACRGDFGWMKACGGLRRTLARGMARVQLHAYLVGAACNLLRMSRLQPDPGQVRPGSPTISGLHHERAPHRTNPDVNSFD